MGVSDGADLAGSGTKVVGLRGDAILHAAGYLTAGCVTAAELLALPLGPKFAWTAALLAAFTVSLGFTMHSAHRARTSIVLLTSIVSWILATSVVAFGAAPTLGGVLYFVISTVVGMRLVPRYAVIWVGASVVALAVCLLLRDSSYWLVSVLSYGVGYFAMFAVAVAFRGSLRARAESQELLRELTSAQGRLRDLAVMEERQRLAREMHDAVGHRLTAAAMLLEGAARLIPSEPDRATHMVETSRQQVKQGLDELRTAVSALRTPQAGPQSVREVLGAIVDVFSRGTDARVTLETAADLVEPDPDRKLVIVRTCQEALTNVQKHAAASRVGIALKVEAGAYVLTCRDDGRGPGPGSQPAGGESGFGLRNLRERVEPFGGQVALEPAAGGGALLKMTLPLSGASHG